MKSLSSISEENGNDINLVGFPDLAYKNLGCSLRVSYKQQIFPEDKYAPCNIFIV